MADRKRPRANTAQIFVISLCGFFILLGVIFLTIGIVKKINKPDYLKNYTRVTAIVKDVEIETHREYEDGEWETYRNMLITVSYEVDGTQYESVINKYRLGTKEGDRIDVYYHNSQPNIVVLDPNDKKVFDSDWFMIVFGVLWLLVAVPCAVIGIRETTHR